MTIAIISDIHDNLVNLKKCLDWCGKQKISTIICCGDITTEDTLKYLTDNFQDQIFIVDGNAELFDKQIFKKYPTIDYHGSHNIIEIYGLRIGFCHEPNKILTILKLSESRHKQPDFIFYGHTHKPWLEKKDGTVSANPGNLAGIFYQATFATLETDTEKLELHILANL